MQKRHLYTLFIKGESIIYIVKELSLPTNINGIIFMNI